jgi:SIR2-like domain
MTRTLLFVGFSLSDLDITLRFDELAQTFGGHGRTHYALMSEDSMDPFRRNRFERDYSIHIIPYRATEGHPEVTEFFQALIDLTR